MRKVDASVAILCLGCLLMLFMSGGNLLAVAEKSPHLTADQAIAAARQNAKPGSSFTILRKIVANVDTQRIGDQAIKQAQAHQIKLFENGLLINMLRSGTYLLAETNPRTKNVVAMHLVLMEAGGAVKDVESPCHGIVNLADARELVKDTAELVKQLHSTPSTKESSLASRFDGGKFPDADQAPDSMFAIPNSLNKLGVSPSEIREAAALFWGYASWASRYALSLPAFAANPAFAENAAEQKRDTLTAVFLQADKINSDTNLIDFDNIRDVKQLQERVELLKKLDGFLEASLRKEADPTITKQNLSVLTIPLRVDVDSNQVGLYESASPPKSLFSWHRVATGGFAVKEITWDW